MRLITALALATVLATPVIGAAAADTTTERSITLQHVAADGTQSPAGSVRVVVTPYGLAFYPTLSGLMPGLHGFHVHQNPSCGPGVQNDKPVAGLAAGGHLDPAATGRHGAPWGDGHLGDLPPLFVAADGTATQPVLAPRLKLADIANRSLMLHAGGDNHADHPMPLGGGGARVVCGVISG